MSDARNRLNDAIASASASKKKGQPAKPEPKPRPQPRAQAPARPSSAPPGKTEDKKPARPATKSVFKKSKKTARPAPKPAPEKNKSAENGGFFKDRMQKFAHNLVDELKNATEEIKPRALLATASDSFRTLKSMVGLDEAPPKQEPRESEIPPDRDGGPAEPEQMMPDISPAPGGQAGPAAPAAGTAAGSPVQFSPAKVQRAPKKRQKPDPAESTAPETPDQEAANLQAAGSAPVQDTPQQPPADAPAPPRSAADYSPAKVQRAPKKKSPETSTARDEEPAASPVQRETGAGAEDKSSSDRDAGAVAPDSEDIPSRSNAAEPAQAPGSPEETARPEPAEAAAPSGSEAGSPAQKPRSAKPAKKPQRPQPAGIRLSKTEQALRSFQALQTVLRNPIWASVVTDPASKPSALYSPREQFDRQFPHDLFREGLKAANRLATTFSFDPEKIRFNTTVIERVKSFQLDPDGKIKKDTDLLSRVLPEETCRKALGMFKDPQVRHLLYSAGTRLGAFVPTIEILARIYLGLRKKLDIIPGERLAIQEEVVMRYQKSSYTEAKANKARNLALSYYTDYLVEHGMKLYQERFESAPDGQNNIESQLRRHEVIKTHCYNLFEERASRIGLSQPALAHLKTRFMETADLFLKTRVGDLPEELLQSR